MLAWLFQNLSVLARKFRLEQFEQQVHFVRLAWLFHKHLLQLLVLYSQSFHLCRQDVLRTRLMASLNKGCYCYEAMVGLWSSRIKKIGLIR